MTAVRALDESGRPPVLVLGATGGQGGAVAEALMRAGQDFRAFVRDPSQLQRAGSPPQARSSPLASSPTRTRWPWRCEGPPPRSR